tara:strand:- start:9058 stop:10356 length:1299 start_codon:yes stop_codon:yes gene_type:complete
MSDNSIVDKIRNNISKKIVNGEKKAIVGYSGGSDSRFLLEILTLIVKDPKKNLIVCHVNYGLRNLESDKDQQLVEKICNSLNLNLEIKNCSLSEEPKGIQEKARKIRMGFFSDLSTKYNTNHCFLGHNINDQIETIMQNIIRGTGKKGLSGMKYTNSIYFNKKKLILSRPLLDLRKKFIEEYCTKNNLEFCVDSSNKKNIYNRNLLRNKIIPEIEKINPQFVEAINNLSKNVNNLDENVEAQKKRIIKDYQSLINEEKFLGRNHHEMINNVITNKSKSENLPGDINIRSTGKSILLESRLNNKSESYKIFLPIPGKIFLPSGEKITSKIINKPTNLKLVNKNNIYISSNYIDKKLFIRNRINGDKMSPFGTDKKIRVKKLLSDYKVSVKSNYPLLCSENEIIWLIGLRQSNKSVVLKTEKKVIELLVSKNSV